MPTYEPNPDHLREAIECVLAQTELAWTLLIHDDASTVNVRAMIENHLKDSRITFIRSEHRLGIGGNWNACLQKASAPFVQFLFQDDLWDKEYLAVAMKALQEHPSAGFVSMHHDYKFEDALDTNPGYEALLAFKQEHLSEGMHDGRAFLRWWMDRGLHPNVIGEPSFVMLRKASTDAAGTFLEDMPQSLDVEYWTRMLQVCDWYYVPHSYGRFRVHASAASNRNQQSGKGIFDRLRCMERVMNQMEGSDRAAAKLAISQQLSVMIGKFLNRTRTGKGIAMEGSGAAKGFALRHPLLTLRGAIAHVCGNRS